MRRIKNVCFVRAAVILTAAAFIGLGICQNGHADMMNKAIRICFECIGIG